MTCRFEELTDEFHWFFNGEIKASYSYIDGNSFPYPLTEDNSPADLKIVIDHASHIVNLQGVSTLNVKAAALVGIQNITCGSLEIRSAPILLNLTFPCKKLNLV